MAISYTNSGASNEGPSKLLTTPERYVSLNDLIGDYAKPDNRDLLVKTYGDQGITGFLQLTGAVTNAGTQDEVQYWEEGRLHRKVTGSISGATLTLTSPAPSGDTAEFGLRLNDVLLSNTNERLVVTALGSDGDSNGIEDNYTVKRLDGYS
mgnify:CR=1 FL=1